MCDWNNSFNYSGYGDYFLNYALHNFNSWNFDDLLYNPITENFNDFGYNFLYINWNWLFNFNWNVLNIADDHRFLDDELNRGEVLNEEGYLSVNNNQLFFYCSERHYFFDENWLLLYHLFIDRNLGMTGHFDNSFFNVRLYEVAFLDNNLFRILLINWFLYFDQNRLWLLAVTMLGVIDRFLHHDLCNFSHFMPFNDWLLNLNELNFSLHNYMMNWSLYDFELRLFVHLGYSLLYFEYFINLLINILGDFSLNFDFSSLYFVSMVRYVKLSLNLLSD